MPDTQTPTPEQEQDKAPLFFVGFALFWVLGGFAAIVMSLVCFGFSGTIVEKIIGLGIAFFMGPLYFIFYGFNKGYCRNLGANVVKAANTFVPLPQ